jgi:hypothetical protein
MIRAEPEPGPRDALLRPEPPHFPAAPGQHVAAHLEELHSDAWATIPAMNHRWDGLPGEASGRAYSALGERDFQPVFEGEGGNP